MLRGRVVGEGPGGLPGGGIEGVWVTVHAIRGPLQLDRLPPALAEVESGPQGSFAVARGGGGEVVVVVRATPDGPVLAAKRLAPVNDAEPELVLQIPAPAPPP